MTSKIMELSTSFPRITLAGKSNAFQGYVYGFRQPTLRYQVQYAATNLPDLSFLDGIFLHDFGISGMMFDVISLPDQEDPVLKCLQHWPSAILNQAKNPVFQSARVLGSSDKHKGLYTIIQPCMNDRAALIVVTFVIDVLKLALKGDLDLKSVKELKLSFDQLIKNISSVGLQGFNQLHFLRAASELGIAWQRLKGSVFRLGVGCNARWLESSYTDETSVIFAALARDKFGTALLLSYAGLPVPKHFIVKNKEDAVFRAEELGYPVVVKPANLDGGQGVQANLKTPQTVRTAFLAAEKLSKHVLVEKHVPGRDYRIQVMNGKVHGILERVPGGVTGNGLDSVRILLEQQNHKRAVAKDENRYLHQIAFDDEAKAQLAAQNFGWDSVPAKDQFVRLRGACNVASGGIPIPIPLERIHPDNIDLVLRAARVMKLDVAGIDLLIPDIECSWFKTGAHICEVNAQPQMFTTLHKPMLQCMFGGGIGRIPAVIIIEAEYTDINISVSVHDFCIARGITAGHFNGKDVCIGNCCVNKQCEGAFDATMMLAFDKSVEALVIHVTDNQIMRKGWPLDYCDVLVVGTRSLAGLSDSYDPLDWLSFAQSMNPGSVYIEDFDQDVYSAATAMFDNETLFCIPSWESREQRETTAMMIVDKLFADS